MSLKILVSISRIEFLKLCLNENTEFPRKQFQDSLESTITSANETWN